MFTVTQVAADRIDPALIPKVRRLTLPTGSMWPAFERCRRTGPYAYIGRCILVEDKGQIVAWGLRFKTHKEQTRWTLHIFVKPQRRREGIGTLIINESTKRLKWGVKGIGWDPNSRLFYSVQTNPLLKMVNW